MGWFNESRLGEIQKNNWPKTKNYITEGQKKNLILQNGRRYFILDMRVVTSPCAVSLSIRISLYENFKQEFGKQW